MVNTPNVTGVIACALLLCVVNATQATERMNFDPCVERKDLTKCVEETAKGIEVVTGEVLRMENNDLFVRRFNGKDVRLHLDANTQMTGIIGRGDRIEAVVDEVNDQVHVLLIRQLKK